jgi:hypothetical protein
LYHEALAILKNENPVDISKIENINKFFTVEEQNSEEFKQLEKEKEPEGFFLRVLLNIPYFRDTITEEDKVVLKYLDHIEILNFQDNDNYRLEFYFKENEFFYNDKLTIEVLVDDDEDFDAGIVEIKGEMIEWKEGKNYLVNFNQEKGEEKNNNSFFWIFKSFKAEDFQEDDEEEYYEVDIDPLSDKSLFRVSVDILDIFKNSFMIYMIPAIYGIDIPEFSLDDEYEDDVKEDVNEVNCVSNQGNNCKTQ